MTNSSREPYRPVLRTDADVTTMWQTLINPLGWHNARVSVILIDGERRPTPLVTEFEEIPDRFTGEDARALTAIFAHLIEEQESNGSLAILVCRPGSAMLTDDDRACCRDIYAAGRDAGVPLEVLHVGTDTRIVPVPMDEVLPRTA